MEGIIDDVVDIEVPLKFVIDSHVIIGEEW